MSNCANIINLLTSQICLLRDRIKSVDSMLNILEINQSIFQNLDTTVFLIRSTAQTDSYSAVPAKIEKTTDDPTCSVQATDTYNGLVSLTQAQDCIIYSTRDLRKYGERSNTGFFVFTRPIEVVVVNVDVEILKKVSQQLVFDALRNCATTTVDETVTCGAYDALLAFLQPYGIRNLDYTHAACIYKYFIKTLNFKTKGNLGGESGDFRASDEVSDVNSPYEPNEPYEPSENYEQQLNSFVEQQIIAESNEILEPLESPEVSNSNSSLDEGFRNAHSDDIYVVKNFGDTTVSDSTNSSGSSSEAIEFKLRKLLEATETSENTS